MIKLNIYDITLVTMIGLLATHSGYENRKTPFLQLSKKTSITANQEHVELLFLANKIDGCLGTAILHTVIGSSNSELLQDMVAPVSPIDKPYDEIVSALKLPIIAEHFDFNRRDQQTEESVAVYMAELR